MKKLFILIFLLLLLPKLSLGQISLQEYMSEDKDFTVLMPDKPKVDKKKLDSDEGTIEKSTYLVEIKNEWFGVSCWKYPTLPTSPDLIEQILNTGRDRILTTGGGKLLTENSINIEGYFGKEIKIVPENGNVISWSRFYVVKNRVYQIYYIGTKEKIKSPEIGKFIASFKLGLYADKSLFPKWVTYTSQEGRFSIQMPEKPNPTSVEFEMVPGKLTKAYTFIVADKSTYTVTYLDAPLQLKTEQDKINYLAGARDGMLRQAKIISSEKISLNGNFGVDTKAETINGVARWRGYLAGNRFYQLYFVGPKELADGIDADKFLNTFKILENKTTN